MQNISAFQNICALLFQIRPRVQAGAQGRRRSLKEPGPTPGKMWQCTWGTATPPGAGFEGSSSDEKDTGEPTAPRERRRFGSSFNEAGASSHL